MKLGLLAFCYKCVWGGGVLIWVYPSICLSMHPSVCLFILCVMLLFPGHFFKKMSLNFYNEIGYLNLVGL